MTATRPIYGFRVRDAALFGSSGVADARGDRRPYCVYHAIENYILVPMIYGHRLRLSGLAVLFAILIGVALGGILGAIIILPVVASYPIIERIWLVHLVGSSTVAKHEFLEK